MTREEAKAFLISISHDLGTVGAECLSVKDGKKMREAIKALEQEPCEDAISRQAALDALCNDCELYKNGEHKCFSMCEEYHFLVTLPPVTPKQKPGYISIDDAMSVFDDYMCGDIDEAGAEIFLEMLKDKAESEVTE